MIPAAGVITELIVLIFNILIFARMTTLKKDCLASRLVMYGGSALCLTLFAIAVRMQWLPESLASFVFATLPTFTLFFILSKYKDFRFFVTFCFLDTVALILTFFARAINIWFGDTAGLIAYILLCALMVSVYFIGTPWFSDYRELTRNVAKGWGPMAMSTLLIYLLLVFAATYPSPMIQRPDFLIVYAFISLTILFFYAVFIDSLIQKKNLVTLNAALIQEQKWHNIAYVDTVTGLNNRMAYIERSNAIERSGVAKQSVDESRGTYAIMLDIDQFKKINDTFGHHTGDVILKRSADFLLSVFNGKHYEVFRIGGDEFAVIALNVTSSMLESKLYRICNPESDLKCNFSCGYTRVDFSKKNAIENAFIEADMQMYKHKQSKKKT